MSSSLTASGAWNAPGPWSVPDPVAAVAGPCFCMITRQMRAEVAQLDALKAILER
jgi:hypothetical protein